MSQISTTFKAATQEFRVGNVLRNTRIVTTRNFPKFFLATAVLSLPNLFDNPPTSAPTTLSGPLAISIGGSISPWPLILFAVAAVLWWVAGSVVAQAYVTFGAFQAARGRPFRVGEALKNCLARFFPIVGVAVLIWLGSLLGIVLLIVPGVILWIMWSVALPACMLEQLSPIASLRRSAELTKGYRWKVFGILLLLFIAGFIPLIVVGALVEALAEALGGAGALPDGVVEFGVTAPFLTFYYVVFFVIYHELRVAKEGVDVDQIAMVFD